MENGEPWITGSPNKSTDPLNGYECCSYTLGGDGQGGNPKGIDQLITNMKTNMNYAEIEQLYLDGILNVSSSFVNTHVPYVLKDYVPPSAYARHPSYVDGTEFIYGELTVVEFTALVSGL